MAKIDLKNMNLYFKDGGVGSAQNILEINIGEGTLSWVEKVTREYSKNRGLLDTVRNGDEEPMDVNFDLLYEYVRTQSGASAGAVSPVDALKKQNGASAWVTTSTDACEPYAIDIEVRNDPPCGGQEIEVVTLPDFRHEQLTYDLRQGTISCTGKCNAVEATVTRVAQT
jgi:hypothetical protein